MAIIREGKLAGVLIITRTGLLPTRDWLIGQLAVEGVGASVLAARGPGSQPDGDDGETLRYIDMPGDMWTYRPPEMPEPPEPVEAVEPSDCLGATGIASCGESEVRRH